MVIISKDKVYLVSKYRSAVQDCEVVCTNNYDNTVAEILGTTGISKVYLDQHYIQYSLIKKIFEEGIEIEKYQDQQLKKTDADFDCLSINAILLNNIINRLLPLITAGESIKDIIRKFKSLAYSFDIQDCFVSIEPVSVSNKSSKKKIDPDMIYLLDCGIKFFGIYSDYTCTFKIHKYTKIELDCINSLIDLQHKISEEIHVGTNTKALFSNILKNWNGSNKYTLAEGFGHSVGTEIHEPFSLYSNEDLCFFDDMIFTIEPQISFIISNKMHVLRIESTFTLHHGEVKNPFLKIPYINVLEKE